MARSIARLAYTVTRCLRYSDEATRSERAVIPSAAFAAAAAIAFASPFEPVRALSASAARYGAAAAPVTPIAARSTLPSDLIVMTAATPVTANPEAGWANVSYAPPGRLGCAGVRIPAGI